LTSSHPTKIQRVLEVYLYSFFNLGARCEWVVAPAVLPLEKNRYPLHRRLESPRDRSGRVRKNLVTTGFRTLNRPASSESLSRLTSTGHFTSKFWVWVGVVSFSDTLLTIYILLRKPIVDKKAEASEQ